MSETADRIPAESDDRNPVDALADSFLARLRRGEYPAISEYTSAHPELADEILAVFPTLAMLEQGGEGLSQQGLAPRGAAIPDEIGEYRLLREIGRGGMGVVYEAEHESMRRRVALKVLPRSAASNEVHRRRFYLEAQVAGRLHHSNIVPVFEVGTDGEFHYYSMQLIQGQSLDVVIQELRRMKDPDAPEGAPGTALSASLAESLWSGSLAATAADGATGASLPAAPPTPPSAEPSSPTPLTTASGSELPGGTPLPSSQTRGDDYFRRVARLGLQIADALSYAHGQGILHRDIKPSNIILDTEGLAWVADFGLAKDEDGDLTRSGDLIGTFRYMAPERFEGHTDARSDIYGLGLTLYELCTLREAFVASERAQLVRAICETTPERPRRINPHVPRDMETILLKAMEKQPANRYQAARQMAEDFRLFLDDHPIKAKQTSWGEHAWRWCRRNPQQAVLCACVAMLLVIITIGSLAFAFVADRNALALSASQRIATERLYQSLRGSAKASRFSGRPGQHFDSLTDVATAVDLLPELQRAPSAAAQERLALRNAAIAALPLPDMRAAPGWHFEVPAGHQCVLSPSQNAFAIAGAGRVRVLSRPENREIASWAMPEKFTAETLRFSPDGQSLAVLYRGNGPRQLSLYQLAREEPLQTHECPARYTVSLGFSLQANELLVAHAKELKALSTQDGELRRAITLPWVTHRMVVSPTSGDLALLIPGRRRVQILGASTWQGTIYETEAIVEDLVWRPERDELVLACRDGSIQAVRPTDAETPYLQVRGTLVGHSSRVTDLYVAPNSRFLLSNAWDGTTRLWDLDRGQQLLRMEGVKPLAGGFASQTGSHVGMLRGRRAERWEVANQSPLQVLRDPDTPSRRWSVDIDDSGRWLASALNDRVEIWDLKRRVLSQVVPTKRREDGTSKDARFLPNGQGLVSSSASGVCLHEPASVAPLQFLPPRVLHPEFAAWVSLSQDGRIAGFREHISSRRGLLIQIAEPQQQVRLGPHSGLDHVQLSPDGRWAATTTWGGRGVRLWDTSTGEPLGPTLLPEVGRSKVIMSQDSQRLYVSTPDRYLAYTLPELEPIYDVVRAVDDGWAGPVAYSPTEDILAVAHTRFVLALLDARTGSLLAVLDAPSDAGFHDCCFSPDGQILAGSTDKALYVWDLAQLRTHLRGLSLDF